MVTGLGCAGTTRSWSRTRWPCMSSSASCRGRPTAWLSAWRLSCRKSSPPGLPLTPTPPLTRPSSSCKSALGSVLAVAVKAEMLLELCWNVAGMLLEILLWRSCPQSWTSDCTYMSNCKRVSTASYGIRIHDMWHKTLCNTWHKLVSSFWYWHEGPHSVFKNISSNVLPLFQPSLTIFSGVLYNRGKTTVFCYHGQSTLHCTLQCFRFLMLFICCKLLYTYSMSTDIQMYLKLSMFPSFAGLQCLCSA